LSGDDIVDFRGEAVIICAAEERSDLGSSAEGIGVLFRERLTRPLAFRKPAMFDGWWRRLGWPTSGWLWNAEEKHAWLETSGRSIFWQTAMPFGVSAR
jgi:hypothetical protein